MNKLMENKKYIILTFSAITTSLSYLIFKKIKEQNKEKKIILFGSNKL